MIAEIEKKRQENLFLLSGAYRKSDYSMIVIISINNIIILKKSGNARESSETE